MGLEMDGNSEIEEGEACFHEDDDNINPDTAFSYIDEKIKNVLGHFQKDFEDGVSAENLGAKFGGYGSFLPTYERSPPRLSHPKIPQKDNSISGSTSNFSTEGASQNLKAPPNAPPTGRPVYSSCPSGNIAAKHDPHLTSALVSEKSALKDESFNRAGIPSDQKTLKVRIKMGSDKKTQKIAAIYSGLGLDFSPSSSLGNSPDESGGTLMVSQETTSKSPTKILQVMTSNHVPDGVLVSPLHDSVLCFLRKENERPSSENKSIPFLRACEEHLSMSMDESVLGNRKQLHEKKTKYLIRKTEESMETKYGNRMNVESGKALLIKKKHTTKIAGGESFPNDMKHIAPSSSVNVAMKSTARVCDVSAEASQNALRGRLISSDPAKENSFESISGRSRSSGKKKKWDKPTSLDENGWEQSVDNSNKNALLDLGDTVGSKCYQKSAPLKLEEDSKTKVGQIGMFRVQNKISIPSKKEKTLFEGKKSKGSKNTGEFSDSMKESLRPDVGVTLKDTTSSSRGFSSGKDKILKLKLHKDINKVHDNHRDAPETNSEQKSVRMEPAMGNFHNRPKDYGPMDYETEHNGYLDKSKVKVSGRMADNQLPSVDAPDVVPHLNDKRLASQTAAPVATAPFLIEENWVQCDRCHKWRLLPFDTRPEQLPEKWLCSMLNWLPGMNRCDISEDETTKALNALYQVPVAENQNKQNHANGSTSLVTSAQPRHLDQNNSSFNSQALSIQGKKNHGLKEVQKAGTSGLNQISNSKNKQQQKSLKSNSLNDMIEAPVESIVMKKSTFEEKERLLVGGETKKAKKKNKRETVPFAYEGSKKSKTELEYTTDKHHSSNLEHRRLGLNSSTSLPTQENGRSVQNCNGGSNSGDVKHDIKEKTLASVKKLVNQTRASSDGGSLDMRICDKRGSVKKRKLDVWQDSQNGNELCMKEESSESGFRNEKKLRFSKIEGKQSNKTDCDDKPNRKSMDHLVGAIEEVRCIDRNQKLGKHKKKSSNKKELDGLDSSRMDSATGQIPIAATSSSSKVSASRKTRVNFEEARGSPVESVSSSPMRTSNPEKRASTSGSGTVAANTVIPSSGNIKRCWNGEGTFELAQSGTEMKEKVSVDFSPGSHKSSTLDYRDRDSICKISIRSKPSSRLGNSHVLNGVSHSAENAQHTVECSHSGNALFSQKAKKVSTSHTKENRSSSADKMKCGEDEKNYSGRRNPLGQTSSDSRMGTQMNIKHDVFDVKSASPCSKKGNNDPEQNAIQDFSGQTKVMQVEVRSGIPKSFLHSETENWQEKKGHQTVPEEEQGVISDEVPVNGSSIVDSSKALKQPGKASSKNVCSPVRENSSCLTVTNALNDAERLRNYANSLKSSGFVFESNEIYFQAALKFLGVAALLETSNNERGSLGDVNQMQVYSTATKLCKTCAQEYEKCQEMAAAALAYKCMQVAYMRVVFCKHSSCSIDLKELQATLPMVSQGESPSSSVSDVDNNLNNQAIADKAPLAKGNVSHFAGTHAVVARNLPSFNRLLDFTQDASFAMEATRKSQTCFVAATSSLGEVQNIEWIASVKRVIDFSFQDVDEFISLVQQATQAINRSG